MQIRAATAADAAEIARVHVAAWHVAYRGQIPDTILDALDVQHRTVRWQEILSQPQGITFVAEATSIITAFSNLIASRDSAADAKAVAEITSIYIHPNHWRQGIGRELCLRTIQEAKHRHFTLITLWVLNTNISAQKFYESMGFTADGATKTEKLKDFDLHELRLRLSL